MIQYLYDENGKYIQTLNGSSDEILAQIPAGQQATILPPPRNTDYFNGTSWVAIGAPPQYYFSFDYAQKKWVDTRNLADCQATRWEEIKLQRNKLEFGGFEFEGKKYDSDGTSQGRMLAAFVFGQPVIWTTSDDEVVSLSKEQVVQLGMAMSNHVQSVHERGRNARVAVYASKSPEEVDAVML